MSLLRFFMIRMLTAASAELPKLQTFSRRLLVLGCYVVAALAIRALQHNIVTRHNVISDFRLPISNLKASHRFEIYNWQSTIDYCTTSETVPAPTVLPPSRIAKRKPFSIAMG